ncbi:chemotaxis protein CheA [Bacillus sp. FJAT-44742]|uniref:chemotaxis protein CheA n=1 Tax=Bacillus sp. FJAT-44742 TaxID=2014005 RepID=UPI000C235FB5|nr:chemotaxis protein CheA [Bacillus sp. FJAT-44742]
MNNNEYLDVFIEESQEHIQAINDNVLRLESDPADLSVVGEVFRSAHTLKGMSATMGYQDLALLTHSMENVLDLVRNNEMGVTSQVIDIIFEAVDALEEMVIDISQGGEGKKDIQDIAANLECIQQGNQGEDSSPLQEIAAVKDQDILKQTEHSYDQFESTVLVQSLEQNYNVFEIKVMLDNQTMLKAARVFMVFEVFEGVGEVVKSSPPVEILENEDFENEFIVTLLSQEEGETIKAQIESISEVEEVHIHSVTKEEITRQEDTVKSNEENNKEKTPPFTNEGENKKIEKSGGEVNKTIRVNIERLDVLMNLFEELVIDRGRLEQISSELNNHELNETVEHMSRISGDLQEIILTMRMMPVEQVFNRFPRMVRSLSKELGKQLKLEVIGAETELDRTIIDEIGDPLVHLIRNSIDHGIESPEVRREAGKPEEGKIILKAYHSGNNVFIEIEDDGAGINKQKVLQKALENEVVTEEEAGKMSDQQVYNLLFASGFSTADEVTDVSGRGVGLDVVRNTFETLGGSVTVDSIEGKGSIFSIQLPLTLSIIDVLLVEVGEEKYGLPLSSIVETAIINKEDIYNYHGQKVIDFRGKIVPLVFLSSIFDISKEKLENQIHSLVIVKKGEKLAGLIVDSLIGQHDVVLKSLGNYLSNVFAISGATILGDGQVALIVDTNALVK